MAGAFEWCSDHKLLLLLLSSGVLNCFLPCCLYICLFTVHYNRFTALCVSCRRLTGFYSSGCCSTCIPSTTFTIE